MNKNLFKDPLSRNIGYLSLLVFVLSLQVLIVLVFIYQFVPLKMDSITQGVPPALLKLFQPNRNHFFYHAFIAAAIVGETVILYLYRQRLNAPELIGEIREFLICETLWVSWQLFAVFKILQYDDPLWARILLYVGFAAALLAKIFWPELKRSFKYFQDLGQGDVPKIWHYMADGGIILLLLLAIMIPDAQKAVIRIAFVDSNNHFDQWLMTPLWAYHKGLIPAVQAFNPLNWGMVVFIHTLASVIGGITYAHVIEALCFLAVVYYAAFYYFLRWWLGTLPAIFGVLLAVKLQMFHIGMSPLAWIFPGQSIVRHLFDVAVFACLLVFSRGGSELFLWLGAVAVGISLSLVFDTGVYMAAAFYAYLAALLAFKETRFLLCPSLRQWRKVLGLIFLPWLSMMIVLVFCFGPVAMHREFWVNSFQDIPRWLKGEDAISIYSCLKDRNFFAFFASFVPPLLYAAGMAGTLAMVYFRRWKSDKLFVIPLSIYGLGAYAHFLWHSSINYYYMVPLPLVGCICFWGTQYLEGFRKDQQRLAKLILAAGAVIALFTNFLFTYYPNIFNIAGEDWGQQKSAYQAQFNFNSDVDLLRQWTAPDQPVALISGFATQILIQADRKTFFYGGLPLMDVRDLERLLNQLNQDKPAQVFVDKRVLINTSGTVLNVLTEYFKAHYQFRGQQSSNLALLQRDHE